MPVINRAGHLGTVQKVSVTATIVGLVTAAALRALGVSNKWQCIALGTSVLGLVSRLSTEPAGRYLDRQLAKTPYFLETASQATYLNRLFGWGATGALKTIESRMLQAAKAGHKDIVEILKPNATYSGRDAAMRGGAGAGREGIVETLKDEVSNTCIDGVICQAAEKGRINIVRMLQDKAITTSIKNAIVGAAKAGYKDIVEMLLKDDHVSGDVPSEAMSAAAKAGHKDILDMLVASAKSGGKIDIQLLDIFYEILEKHKS